MLGGVVVAVYAIGFFATPYVMGLLGDDDDALIIIPMLIWPVFAVGAAPILIGKALMALGHRHRGCR